MPDHVELAIKHTGASVSCPALASYVVQSTQVQHSRQNTEGELKRQRPRAEIIEPLEHGCALWPRLDRARGTRAYAQ
jgi:hypothetical protein